MLSLIVLALAIVARYSFRLRGPWSHVYVFSAVVALYFNVFVLVVQAFLKVPALKLMAPTQAEPPFVAVQAIVVVLFVASGVLAALRFRAA